MLRSKIEALEVQFAEHNLDIVGIQEGRARSTGELDGVEYKMLSVAADARGNAGVQLWIRRHCGARVVEWRDVSCRFMYAVLKMPNHGMLIVLVFHAHHDGKAASLKERLWEPVWTTSHDLRNKHPEAKLLMLVDANGRVGSVPSRAVGMCESVKENDGGSRLRAYCENFGLALTNTFTNAGHTWTSPHGPQHRIDYVACEPNGDGSIPRSWVDGSIDLSLNAYEDHRVVISKLTCTPGIEVPDDHRASSFKPNKLNFGDPRRVDEFQQLMWQYAPKDGCSVDQSVQQFNDHVRRAALQAFGRTKDVPRKKWISMGTWGFIRGVAPARRSMNNSRKMMQVSLAKLALTVWADAAQYSKHPARNASMRAASVRTAHETWVRVEAARWWCARWFRWIKWLQLQAAPSLAEDRKKFLDDAALRSCVAMGNNDSRTGYAIVRALGSCRKKANSTVLKLDGELTQSTYEEAARWEQHYASVYRGKPTDEETLLTQPWRHSLNFMAHDSDPIDINPPSVEKAIAKLGNNKGTGPDGIPAELLKAGGAPVAIHLCSIFRRIAHRCVWPIAWQMGEIVNVWKGKGDTKSCDAHRGILLEDHAGKALKGMIKDKVDPLYEKFVPATQFGATRGRGTDFATHMVVGFAELARMRNWSFFALFLDLHKAFDFMIRELVFGWTGHEENKVARLVELGASIEAATWIKEYIDENGSAFEQMKVGPHTTSMVRSMHDGAWFKVRNGSKCISSETGGRQGCKLGSTVFNSGYTIALKLLQWKLKKAGITLRVSSKCEAFWSDDPDAGGDGSDEHDVIDVTFVDDECVLLMASTPSKMADAAECMIKILGEIFNMCNLHVNFAPGKTEAIAAFRGDGACGVREKRWRQEDGSLAIPLNELGFPGETLRLVREYRHLGTYVDASGVAPKNSVERAKSARAAYAPISMKVFGSDMIGPQHKWLFMTSLINSRLTFNAHVACVKPKPLAALNGVYMRVLRRIGNEPRHGRCDHTDVEIREMMGAPSMDAMLVVARLKYARRLLTKAPPALPALLGSKWLGKRMPWTTQLVDDLHMARKLIPRCAGLGDPSESTEAWVSWIKGPHMENDLRAIRFCESLLDRAVQPDTACISKRFPSADCGDAFSTAKALASHRRCKHGVRSQWRYFIRSSTCPSCQRDFKLRVRCLNHLGDRRRPACADFVVKNCQRLPDVEVLRLDTLDAEQRLLARKAGRTQVLTPL